MLTCNAARAPVLPVLHGVTILCGVLPFESTRERAQLRSCAAWSRSHLSASTLRLKRFSKKAPKFIRVFNGSQAKLAMRPEYLKVIVENTKFDLTSKDDVAELLSYSMRSLVVKHCASPPHLHKTVKP